jgi:hypothetical protein
MTATSVVCPECGSPVAPGRLSCQDCGTLLASVVGSTRPPLWASTGRPLPEVDEDRPLASVRREGMPAAAPFDDLSADESATGEADVAVDPGAASAPVPAKRGPRRLPRPKAPAALASRPAPQPAPAKARYVRDPGPAQDASTPAPLAPIEESPVFAPVPSLAPPILHEWIDQVAPSAVAAPAAPTARTGRGRLGRSRPTAPDRGASVGATGAAPAPRGPVAGAYLAPSATYVAAVPTRDRGAPWQAGSTNGGGSGSATWPPTLRSVPSGWNPAGNGQQASVAGTPSAVASAATNAAPAMRNEVGAARTLADWLILGGATLALVSFVLPWATDGVIGSRGAGYTADWGLANPGHLLMIAAAAAVLILHLVANPMPAWFRSGVLPLLIGGILAGLAFAYYARPAGGGAGVAVLLAGAVVLIVGGSLAGRPVRNAGGASSV